MLLVFLIDTASLMSLPSLSDSRSITLAFVQSITWFSLQTWSVIADTGCPGLFCSRRFLWYYPLLYDVLLLLLPVAFLFLQRKHVHSFYTVSYKPPLAFPCHWARVKEHHKEVDSITGMFTRAEKTRAASICNKSAITDHVCNENHVIDWANAKVIDRESGKAGRLIREAIWIRKTDNMNWDEGSFYILTTGTGSQSWWRLPT